MTNIGFIGLGNMGRPMAHNLLKAGHRVCGYDLSQEAREALRAMGGETMPSVAAAVAEAEAIITMLPSGREVRDIYLCADGVLAHAPPQSLFVDCSTVDVATARAVAAKAAERGFTMLDAPVSGGVGGAAAGTLTFMVGGSESAFTRAHPLLAAMGRTVVHAGSSGAGQAAKICNNMILGITMIGVSEAFVLAERLGLDAQRLFDIASTSSGQCWSLTSYCPAPGPVPSAPSNRNYAAGFTAAMMLKDLSLAQDAARGCGAATPLGAEAAALYGLYCAHGAGPSDFSGIIRFLRGAA